ncbi:MAG: CpaF family protein [Candidatus Pristimantibacillus lignocellulolyticus]|uniref:CpaF family protein n=1 Tax=Candidatus Pristimantibacillus lignocellulolyticus TaxID=2994561 RepID=A0A9J6Z9V6_9BACL|nr:MAG: CpaF family protein [Candidatus Pristimantibacillus lignocellulolyticus]
MIDDKVIYHIRNELRDSYAFSQALSDQELHKLIEDEVLKYSKQQIMSTTDKLLLVKAVFHSFRGLDILQPLLDDNSITEIMINSEHQIFVERHGNVEPAAIQFENRERLEDIIQQIVSSVNRVVNEASPIVDARLANGSRVNIVLPPIALRGPCVTIRKFPEQPLTMDTLMRMGALSEEAVNWLSFLVKAKYNIFIGGGTGSGKTTFLNALTQFIPSDERIITIEDAAELQITSIPNLVSLETRNVNTEGKGEIAIRDLIKASLRMRPNRIIVGEVRGKEALDMLQAMNTGHEGSMSTGHANNVKDMLSRLETMVLSAHDLPLTVVRSQICSAIDIMIHLTRFHDRSRGVLEISQIIGMQEGEIVIEKLFQHDISGHIQSERLIRSTNRLHRVDKLLLAGYREEELMYGSSS